MNPVLQLSVCVCLCVTECVLCFSENVPGWELDIQHDVIEECNKHGGVVHIYVDKNSAEVRLRPLTSLIV